MSSFLLHSAAFAALLVSTPLTDSFTLPINKDVVVGRHPQLVLQAASSADDPQRRPPSFQQDELDPLSTNAQDGLYEQQQQEHFMGEDIANSNYNSNDDVNNFLRSSEFANLAQGSRSARRRNL